MSQPMSGYKLVSIHILGYSIQDVFFLGHCFIISLRKFYLEKKLLFSGSHWMLNKIFECFSFKHHIILNKHAQKLA